MQLVDECNLYLKAGSGGNGIVSWRREANVPEGGPYGGDGGNGGDIVAIGDHNQNTLFDWRNHKEVYAQNGENGRTAKESGKGGVTTYIKLPLGTSIYDSDTNELLADILESGQTYVVCQGGKAGHGNAFFKSSFNRAPTLYENGDAGEEKNITLKLRFLADVGLVGLPNAGKSTLVNQISNAKPRIANYQFTTLIPVLGVVNIKDHKLVFADMPGLIEGAAKGKGLGHDFLKHIERCQIFIHLISLNPIDSDDVVKSYKIVTNELKKYSKELLKKPIIIVANKIDTEGAKENLEKLKKSIKKNIFVISAKNNEGVNELLNEIYKEYDVIQKTNEQKLKNKSQGIKVIEVKQQKDYHKDLRIIKVDDDKWEVQSEFMKYWTNRIPLTTKDNLVRYNQKLKTLEIEDKAKQLGAKSGDTLLVYGNEMTID